MSDSPNSTQEAEPIQNRSELLFLYDAQDCNPNGNPLSPTNSPRLDPVTEQAIVTDVRLKRYLRDQLGADGHGVYVANTTDDEGDSPTREYLATAVTDVESRTDITDDFLDTFLDAAADVRYFGATLPFKTDDDGVAADLAEHLPQQLTGPVQFAPGRSIHRVRTNENYDSLTSVIATKNGKNQGGYQLDDNRIVYGLIGFSAVVNEHSAAKTHLSADDVSRLDSLCWRAVKNQANSRSKRGQHPRLYLRVEYETGYHIGNLDNTLDLGSESSPPDELTSVTDATVDISTLVDRLTRVSDRIDTVYITHDPFLALEGKDDTHLDTDGALKEQLEEYADVEVEVIDPATAYTDTLPDT